MDKSIAEKILSLVSARNVSAADVFIRTSASTAVEVKDQQVDAFERARDAGAGLRVIVHGRLGFAFTTDFTDAALGDLADAAVTNAKIAEPDEYLTIPGKPV